MKTNWKSYQFKSIYKSINENLLNVLAEKNIGYEEFKEKSGISEEIFRSMELLELVTQLTVDRFAAWLEIDKFKLVSEKDYYKLRKGNFSKLTPEWKDRLSDTKNEIDLFSVAETLEEDESESDQSFELPNDLDELKEMRDSNKIDLLLAIMTACVKEINFTIRENKLREESEND